MHSSWRRTRSLTCRPTTEIESFSPRWAIFRAASHGGGGAQLSPPSETRITVRSPLAPRSSGAFSSERPIGVRPLPSSAFTLALKASRSSGPTGVSRLVSLHPSARATPLTRLPYARRPTLAPSGTAPIRSVSADLAASSRVPPSPASSFIESEPSRMISTDRSSSWARAGAAQNRPRTHKSAPRQSPGTLELRRWCRLLALEDLLDGRADRGLDLAVDVGGEQRGEDDGEEGEDARVLDGRLAALLAETKDEVLNRDGGAKADVLHWCDPLSRSCGRLTDPEATFGPGVPPEAQVSSWDWDPLGPWDPVLNARRRRATARSPRRASARRSSRRCGSGGS